MITLTDEEYDKIVKLADIIFRRILIGAMTDTQMVARYWILSVQNVERK